MVLKRAGATLDAFSTLRSYRAELRWTQSRPDVSAAVTLYRSKLSVESDKLLSRSEPLSLTLNFREFA